MYGELSSDCKLGFFFVTLVCNFGLQFWFATLDCNFGLPLWIATLDCNFGLSAVSLGLYAPETVSNGIILTLYKLQSHWDCMLLRLFQMELY